MLSDWPKSGLSSSSSFAGSGAGSGAGNSTVAGLDSGVI